MNDFSITTKALLREAKKEGIEIEFQDLESRLVRLKKNNKIRYICKSRYYANSMVTYFLCKDKKAAKKVLEWMKIRVPQGFYVSASDKNKHTKEWFLKKIKFPVVIKDNEGSLGENVFIVHSKEEFFNAYDHLVKNKYNFVIEEFVKGSDHRFLVIEGKIQAVTNRVPANVVGDGKHTIKSLIDLKNKDPRRGEKGKMSLVKIQVDKIVKEFLAKNKLSLFSIPKKGEVVYLRANANISTGGDSIDCTDTYHKNYDKICKTIYQNIPDLVIIGVDILSKDITKDPLKGNYCIIEMNARPDFDMHEEPYIGKKRNIAKKILKVIFKD